MHIRDLLIPYRNQLTPFHIQCPPYVWLACPLQQKVSASGDWWSCRGRMERERIELHLFNLYFFSSLFILDIYAFVTHIRIKILHPLSLFSSISSTSGSYFLGQAKIETGGLWELRLFRASRIEHSCICALREWASEYVMVVRSINSAANHCVVPHRIPLRQW